MCVCVYCIAAYIYICGNIVNNYDDFNERTNTLPYKDITSHNLFLKGRCWLCARHELETGTDCYIDPNSPRDHSSTSSSSWLVLLNRGSLRAQSSPSAAGSHAGILSPTDSSRLCLGYIIVYVHLLPLFFRLFTQVHLLIDGSVEGQYITCARNIYQKDKITRYISCM